LLLPWLDRQIEIAMLIPRLDQQMDTAARYCGGMAMIGLWRELS